MPTVFSHPAPVLALAALLGGRLSTRMLLFGILCAVLPDADVIGFRFGISYARRVRAPGVFPFPRVCPAHGLCRLRSGPAVPARFTPHGIHRRPSGRLKPYPAGRNDQRRTRRSRVLALRQTRYFCDWRPIRVSPFGLKGLLSQRGLSVMLSELRWVWAPCLAVIAAALFFGKNPMRAIPRK